MVMSIEKMILAIITTNPKKAPSGIAVFHCDNQEEMYKICSVLEPILDGIAHKITDEIMIIVKH
ncbi:hypothetical protein B4064_0549 [Caldibacillus thermoamylovorans]|uniref:Uncharacterized protein n=1 Tax=Caldibacillus thermoamylovorans TaxID=35841 RepID=A0A0D0G4Y8_9BACI|nr:hypothetical protein B4064_0549 [Caldibacillus thermoamylovorans]KIO65587.1 hypothetical protein B4065_0512 [Caldibacillus thermoamylovorans]KIO72292.1 hypothetical protein B4167_0620 [Caldibacillus thermoamylovorans]